LACAPDIVGGETARKESRRTLFDIFHSNNAADRMETALAVRGHRRSRDQFINDAAPWARIAARHDGASQYAYLRGESTRERRPGFFPQI
jgi:hypothetical protein